MKWILFLVLMFVGIQGAWAQRILEGIEEPEFSDRVYFGGGGNLQFSNNFFVVGVSPLAGYMLTNRLSAGLGATYQYARYGGLINQSTHTYGGRLFSRYNLFKSVFTMVEYEQLSIEVPQVGASDIPRQWADRFLVGGGYFQQSVPRGSFYMGLFYDLLYRPYGSPFNSPLVYRVGFTF